MFGSKLSSSLLLFFYVNTSHSGPYIWCGQINGRFCSGNIQFLRNAAGWSSVSDWLRHLLIITLGSTARIPHMLRAAVMNCMLGVGHLWHLAEAESWCNATKCSGQTCRVAFCNSLLISSQFVPLGFSIMMTAIFLTLFLLIVLTFLTSVIITYTV